MVENINARYVVDITRIFVCPVHSLRMLSLPMEHLLPLFDVDARTEIVLVDLTTAEVVGRVVGGGCIVACGCAFDCMDASLLLDGSVAEC